jgi:hypothetical protein
MSRFLSEHVLTVDNLLHGLVAVAFTCLAVPVLVYLGPVAGRLGVGLGWLPFLLAALAGLGLYLREAAQVGWDFTLRWSAHKWLEAMVGTAAAFVAAGVMAVAI